jgi:hypothetical protein
VGQKLANAALWAGALSCNKKKSQEQISSFRIRRTTVLGMFKDSTIFLNAIRLSFFTKSATTTAMLPQFKSILTATSHHLLPALVLKQNFMATLCSFLPSLMYGKTDFKRQIVTCTVSKINKQNLVCEQMLVDST